MINKYDYFVTKGQSQMTKIMKQLVYNSCISTPEIKLLNQKAFLEPHLFSYFNSLNQAVIDLDQVLFGYLDHKGSREYSVRSNNLGEIYLPNYGLIKTKLSSSQLLLKNDASLQLLNAQGDTVAHKFYPRILVDGFSYEIICHQDETLKRYFINELGEVENVTRANYEKHAQCLRSALEIIRSVFPKFYNAMKRTTNKFYLYNGSPNSFATINAHGIAFLNLKPKDGLPFFIDEIVHQCGHIVFNTMTFEKHKLFKIDPDTPAGELIGEQDHVDIYGRFHGLFTHVNMNICFERCLNLDVLTTEEKFELEGRFAMNMNRFKVALDKFDLPNVYTGWGNSWFQFFKDEYERLALNNRVKDYIVNDQPYIFDYELFKKSNEQKFVNSAK